MRAALAARKPRGSSASAGTSRFYAAAAADRVLAPLVRPSGGLFGLRRPRPDPFEMLVGAISAQQVNLALRLRDAGALVRRYGTPVEFEGVTVHALPRAGGAGRGAGD